MRAVKQSSTFVERPDRASVRQGGISEYVGFIQCTWNFVSNSRSVSKYGQNSLISFRDFIYLFIYLFDSIVIDSSCNIHSTFIQLSLLSSFKISKLNTTCNSVKLKKKNFEKRKTNFKKCFEI